MHSYTCNLSQMTQWSVHTYCRCPASKSMGEKTSDPPKNWLISLKVSFGSLYKTKQKNWAWLFQIFSFSILKFSAYLIRYTYIPNIYQHCNVYAARDSKTLGGEVFIIGGPIGTLHSVCQEPVVLSAGGFIHLLARCTVSDTTRRKYCHVACNALACSLIMPYCVAKC